MANWVGRKISFMRRLKDVRLLRDLKQSELAEMAGVHVAAISHYEAGSRSPTLDNLASIAMALKVSVDYLLGISDDMRSTRNWQVFPKKFAELSHLNQKIIIKMIDVIHKESTNAFMERIK